MKYDLIYCDPCWEFNSKKTGGSMKSGAAQVYDVMDIEALKRMPVGELANKDCYLFMWYVGAMPQEALDLVKAWGFKVKNMNGLVWRKLTATGKPVFGMGYHTRAGSESCLVAVKGSPKPASRSVRAVFEAKISNHSAKPKDARLKIEEIAGNGRKIELFARGEHGGQWSVFGNQAYPSIVLDEYGWRQPYLAELELQLEEVNKYVGSTSTNK